MYVAGVVGAGAGAPSTGLEETGGAVGGAFGAAPSTGGAVRATPTGDAVMTVTMPAVGGRDGHTATAAAHVHSPSLGMNAAATGYCAVSSDSANAVLGTHWPQDHSQT